jgi:drug/metabolite transporter (DMT)-like permease
MKEKSIAVQILGVILAIVWGLTFLSIKVAVTQLAPMSLALMRFVIALMLLPFVALFTRQSLKVGIRDLPIIAVGGFIGISLYFFFENNGIMRLSASESSIIVGTIPIVTLLAEVVFFHGRPGKKVIFGVFLSFVGVAAMVLRSGSAKSSATGYLFMVGAAVSWSAYTFLTRPVSAKYPLLAITFWQIFFGMLGCIPFALFEHQTYSTLSFAVLLNVLYLGIFGSAIGYWIYVIILDRLGPGKSSVFINLIPVVSIIASFFILGERLAVLQLAGGALAIIGVFLATAP